MQARLFLLYRFFDDFIWIYPLYLAFMAQSLSPWEISILLAVWSLASLLSQIPGGVLADSFSRPLLLLLAQLLRVTGYVIWLVFPGFMGYLIGFIFWGLKSGLTNSAATAHAFELNILGQSRAVSLLAISLASILASAFHHLGFPLILQVSILSLLFSSLFLLLLAKQTKVTLPMPESKQFIYRMPEAGIRNLILFSASVLAVDLAFLEFIPLIIKDSTSHELWLGPCLALLYLVQAAGSYLAVAIKTLNAKTAVFFAALALLVGCLYGSLGMILALYLFYCLIRYQEVLQDYHLQEGIEPAVRGRIISIRNLLAEGLSIPLILVYGALAKNMGYTSASVFFVFVLLSVLLLLAEAQIHLLQLCSNSSIYKKTVFFFSMQGRLCQSLFKPEPG